MQRAVDDIRPMTDEQAATLKRLAQAAYELDAFKPKLTRAEADLRIAALAAKLKLLGGPPHTLGDVPIKPNLTRNPISNTTPAIAPDKRGGKQDRACVWCGVVAPGEGLPEHDHVSYRFDVMNNRAEAFKKKALQYERAANVATDADACRMYLGLARQLRVMAEQAEAFERAATLRQGIWWSEASSRE